MSTFIEIIKFILDTMIAVGLLNVVLCIIKFLKIKIKSEEQKKVLSDVEIAVTSAEQLYASGEGKKGYVEELLRVMGYEMDDKMNAMIENTVNKLFPFHYEEQEVEEDNTEE